MSSSPRILILGASGQVGRELQRSFAGMGKTIALDRSEVDLADREQIRAVFRTVNPSVVLNAAAYTAVDRAESEEDLAMAINAQAPGALAEAARRLDALLVHYSTDYVFDGSKQSPWVESDAPGPLNIYGKSKLAGERAIEQVGGRYLIFRTSWVYGPHGHNFLKTMLRLGGERDRLTIVDDQIGAPTTCIAIADATREIVTGALDGRFGGTEAWSGLYHMTCGGKTSWFGFAQRIFATAGASIEKRAPELIPIRSEDYPTPAKRPRFSVLSNDKLQRQFGVTLPDWTTALEEVLLTLNEGMRH